MEKQRTLSIHAKVERDLRLIRETMVRATAFEPVAGSGWILMGLFGFAGAWIAGPLGAAGAGDAASAASAGGTWLATWLVTAAVAATCGLVVTQRTASELQFRLDSAPARRFWALLGTPFAVAAVLTVIFALRGHAALLPGTWLLLYGLGLHSGGSLCRGAVRRAGLAFQVLGLLAFAWPEAENVLLAVGFGGVHVVGGIWMLERGKS